ncbi:MAG: NADP-dependent oxidoreductase, partial [Planctomycetaceae bacterium]
QEYGLSSGEGLRTVNPDVAPLTAALHVLGMPGLTAYFGLFDVCQVQRNETVVVSGAAGAVGSVVGQLAKSADCRVVGIAGSDDKIRYITQELGYDGGVNYKTTTDIPAALAELCPQGVDIYFDNVGGPVTDAVFPLLNVSARVGICGQISQYNARETPQGPRLLGHLIVKRAMIRGFLVLDFADQYRLARSRLTEFYQAGTLSCRERITDGIENAPRAFMEMMQGANIGKQLVRLCPE